MADIYELLKEIGWEQTLEETPIPFHAEQEAQRSKCIGLRVKQDSYSPISSD